MKIKDFGVEMYMNAYEDSCTYNLAETCVSSLTVDELLTLSGEKEKAIDDILNIRLTYGHIVGSPALKENVCGLYKNARPDNIIMTHGAIGANNLVMETLVEPGDAVISVLPTYQQLYSIPEAIGAEVKILPLNMENNFLPDLDLLSQYMSDKVKLVCVNNPNNPSGSLMDEEYLKKIVEIVKPYGSYILCDEAYRGLTHEGENLTTSMFDLYEKGIGTASMSKTFSLAGLRMGWVAGPQDFIDDVFKHRDYNTISCGAIDDYLAALALKNKQKIFDRNLAIVRNNLQILDEWVKNEPHIDYVKPRAGTTAFLKLNIDMKSMDFCLGLLEKTGAILLPGSAMQMEGFLRIGYAYESKLLKTGLQKVSEYIATIAP